MHAAGGDVFVRQLRRGQDDDRESDRTDDPVLHRDANRSAAHYLLAGAFPLASDVAQIDVM